NRLSPDTSARAPVFPDAASVLPTTRSRARRLAPRAVAGAQPPRLRRRLRAARSSDLLPRMGGEDRPRDRVAVVRPATATEGREAQLAPGELPAQRHRGGCAGRRSGHRENKRDPIAPNSVGGGRAGRVDGIGRLLAPRPAAVV